MVHADGMLRSGTGREPRAHRQYQCADSCTVETCVNQMKIKTWQIRRPRDNTATVPGSLILNLVIPRVYVPFGLQ